MSSIPFSVAFITPGSFDVIAFSIRPPSCTSLCSVRSSDCSMQSAVFLPLYPLPHKTSEYRFLESDILMFYAVEDTTAKKRLIAYYNQMNAQNKGLYSLVGV